MYVKRCFVLFISSFLFISCQTTPKITNMSPAALYSEPNSTIYRDPDTYLFYEYKTFSVFPASLISKEVSMNPILERQLLFFVRTLFERKGYKFVQPDKNPDFRVTVLADIQYKETYIPPSSITLPHRVPGKTITTYGSTSGNFNFNTSGNFSSNGWGNWSGSSTSTTYIPGYMTTKTYTRPGYIKGRFFPMASILVYDGNTFKKIWSGSGAGTSDNPDVRISGQLVLVNIANDFPLCNIYDVDDYEKMDGIGIYFGVFTNDGNSYFPTIIHLKKGMSAQKVGLRLYDMIIEVDGVSTLNKSYSEAEQLLSGPPNSQVNVKIKRLNEMLDFTLTRTTL